MTTPPCTNRRILIVDDNESIHRDFGQILGGTSQAEATLSLTEAALFGATQTVVRDGFALDSAFQGQQGLAMVTAAIAEGRPYAMAFVDMRMPPGWDGIETIEQLWKVDPQLQIAICSAFSDYSWEDMASRLELRDRLLILKKPFDNIEIYQLACALTAKWQLGRESAQRLTSLEDAVNERTADLRTANESLRAEVLERQRLESRLALRLKLESIGQLAAGVAHEINTPIQYIGDSLYFLKSAFADINALQQQYERLFGLDGNTAPAPDALSAAQVARAAADLDFLRQETPRACDRALAGVEQVAAIVRAMKDFAHPTTQDQGSADINEALKSTLLVAHNEYKYLAQVEIELGELPRVMCNIGELNQVFLNLIINAAHAVEASGKTLDSGRIVVRTMVDATHAMIFIGDNGTGVPREIADKIFDPFFTTKEVGKGTGQGLAISHAIVVTNHGGTLTFESRDGQGTTFEVRLPIEGLGAANEQKAA